MLACTVQRSATRSMNFSHTFPCQGLVSFMSPAGEQTTRPRRVVGHGCCQIKSQQCFALLYNLSHMLGHSRSPESKISCSPSASKCEIFSPFTFATMPDVTLGITKIYTNHFAAPCCFSQGEPGKGRLEGARYPHIYFGRRKDFAFTYSHPVTLD